MWRCCRCSAPADQAAVLTALGVDGLPGVDGRGVAQRRPPAPTARRDRAGAARPTRAPRIRTVVGPTGRRRGAARRNLGLRGRYGWQTARRGWAWTPTGGPSARGRLDRPPAIRRRNSWTRAATAARRRWHGCTTSADPAHAGLSAPRRFPERPAAGDPVLAAGRPVGRLAPSSTTSTWVHRTLALVKRGLPADTALSTGGEHPAIARIDPDSLPPADVTGAGRLAVERLRGEHH